MSGVVTIGTVTGSIGAGVVFRATDSNNYWMAVIENLSGGRIALYRRQSGTFAVVKSLTLPLTAGTPYTISVNALEDIVTVSLDGATCLVAVSAFNETATLHGMRDYSSTAASRIDNFSVLTASTLGMDREPYLVLTELETVATWSGFHGSSAIIGEFGWPNPSPYASPIDNPVPWNDLGLSYAQQAKTDGIWLAQWNTGETQKQHKLGVYSTGTGPTIAPLSVAESQATVFESVTGTASFKYGINLSGGEYGGFSQVGATSESSNAREKSGSSFSYSAPYSLTLTAPGYNAIPYANAWNYGSEATWQFLGSRSRKPSFVRLCFRMERVYRTMGGSLDATEIARLDQALTWAASEGIPVLLDCHNFGYYYLDDGAQGVATSVGGATVTSSHFADFWGKMAAHFKSDAGVLGYDLMNEPFGATSWMSVAQAAVTAIRAESDTKLIIVSGIGWGTIADLVSFTPSISDPSDNIRYGAHHYWDDGSGAFAQTYAYYNT